MASKRGKPMKNKRREEKRLGEERRLLVKAAIEQDLLTRADIAKATGLTQRQVSLVLTENKDLQAEFRVLRRMIKDEASDALHDIVRNKKHPQHFQAVKYVLQNFKTELDETLDSKESTSLELDGTGGGAGRVIIKFGD